MTPQTAIELAFADGDYAFDLKLPQLAELQEKRKAGIFAIYGRLMQGRYLLDGEVIGLAMEGQAFAEDIYEVIRLGLIGGGRGLVDGAELAVSALTAKRLVENYVHPAPLREVWGIAAAIIGARVEGYDPPKKAEPAKAPAKRKSRSTSPKSSRTAAHSASTGEP